MLKSYNKNMYNATLKKMKLIFKKYIYIYKPLIHIYFLIQTKAMSHWKIIIPDTIHFNISNVSVM